MSRDLKEMREQDMNEDIWGQSTAGQGVASTGTEVTTRLACSRHSKDASQAAGESKGRGSVLLMHLENLLLNHKSEFQETELCRITEWKHNTWPAVEPRELERVRKVYPTFCRTWKPAGRGLWKEGILSL